MSRRQPEDRPTTRSTPPDISRGRRTTSRSSVCRRGSPVPGTTPDSTWDFLINRGDGNQRPARGPLARIHRRSRHRRRGRERQTRGGYLDDVKGFDAEFFAMSPVEVATGGSAAAPETGTDVGGARARANSGQHAQGEQVGVFIGSSTNDYQLISALGLGKSDPDARLGRCLRADRNLDRRSSPTGCRTSTISAARRSRWTPRARRPLVAVHKAVREPAERRSRSRRGRWRQHAAGTCRSPSGSIQSARLANDGMIKAFSVGRRRHGPQ